MNQRIILIFISAALFLGCSSALAQTNPYANRFEQVPATYSFEINTSVHSINRTRFSRPVFLFANRLQKIRSEAIVTDLTMNVHWTDTIALQFSFPLVARLALVEFAPVQISENQTLPSQSRKYSGFGVGDPTLSLSWLAWEKVAAVLNMKAKRRNREVRAEPRKENVLSGAIGNMFGDGG